MVKRAIAILLGAAAGVALWYLAVWAREAMQPQPVMSFGDCVRYGYDCVSYDAEPQEIIPLIAPAAPADPCKSWLAGADGGVAALSQCLHTARRGVEREQLEKARWVQRTSAAS
jgi:hypothetical protein